MFFKSRLFNESLLVICFIVEIFASNDTSAVTDPSALCKVNDVLFLLIVFYCCAFFFFSFFGVGSSLKSFWIYAQDSVNCQTILALKPFTRRVVFFYLRRMNSSATTPLVYLWKTGRNLIL